MFYFFKIFFPFGKSFFAKEIIMAINTLVSISGQCQRSTHFWWEYFVSTSYFLTMLSMKTQYGKILHES